MVALFLFHWSFYRPTSPATLTIDFGNNKRAFQGEVVNDMTILDVLNMAKIAGGVVIEYSINSSGEVSILKIGDYLNDTDGQSFHFYLNSKEVNSRDLASKEVGPGDNVSIKLE